ncbi:uncharacterized protein LOC105388245 isoform X1 [Plutella xylostella]|uniref:uncharacterized protein LOC105388245 isoform X1 n=1 Tax=Plutella xylostella TaxID=51655 RepID=UPI0020323488|nr:uncharacterized protein LOC105388245 isoform X1 [Plutella xylostella]XP_037970010.2 uncharacterized protein LOC105388245 isoform X1 [Plutella xylostella]
MDEMDEIVAKLNIPTYNLKSDKLQSVMLRIQQIRVKQITQHNWKPVLDLLWQHLINGLENYDDQLLCATSFFTVLSVTEKQEIYLNKVLVYFEEKWDSSNYVKTSFLISLMYGMYQSAFLQKTPETGVIVSVTVTTFNILTKLAYDYAWYTFLVFKTINSFKKVHGTHMQEHIFNTENQIKLLNLVNHNWENPITGVRDLNKTIFQTLISVMEPEVYELVIVEINGFYWNKAKYLMLSETIEVKGMTTHNKMDWVHGLVNSLYKPGLVSAGADMYFAILKNLRSDQDWCDLFLGKIIGIFTGRTEKAIENFTNYWGLTTFKKFPLLVDILLKELNITDGDSSNKLYSFLSITKQANKLGLWKRNMINEKEIPEIMEGLQHHRVNIRMSAFEIICVSQGKAVPSDTEFNSVYEYLQYNINSDSTVLRLNMLSNFKLFLTRIHTSLHDFYSPKDSFNETCLAQFCEDIQQLVIYSLNLKGNYQRKISSLKMYDCILSNFTEIPKRKQKIKSTNQFTTAKVLKQEGRWKLSNEAHVLKLISMLQDPADDVRESVINILYKHYFYEIKTHLSEIINSALLSLKSKFFYEISCGQSMIKLVVNVLLKEKQLEGTFQSVEGVFLYGCEELNSEYKLKTNIMESIEKGRQLHSFISIIITVLEVCLEKTYQLQVNETVILELLKTLDGISNQFAWDGEGSISADFSKMSSVVDDLIQQSGYNPQDEIDKSKISGLHQIVLNSMWLNVKACCELSSLIIRYHHEDSHADICGKSLSIITHVLETSRHKGAIEAAGAALGLSIRHLTSLPKESVLSQLPYSLLKRKLNELISEAGKMASITRRGAGLSIMVHRIVASDMKKGKPLFHHFMRTLLATCNRTEDMPATLTNTDIDNEKDLPKAIYIHFLTRIVTDSSLASDMMHYTASLGELAFSNLTSNCWQIRNAALQLYGALVPKLIGQRKSSGQDEETIATVASDEVRTHLPELWQYMCSQLKSKDRTDNVLTHSDLVPILNMLANTAVRYNFAHDKKISEESYAEMFRNLMCLLGSPIYTVRRLTARCIYNNFAFEVVHTALQEHKYMTENYLHGCLILTSIYRKQFASTSLYETQFGELEELFTKAMEGKNTSFINKAIFDETFCKETNIVEVFDELGKNKHAPGIHLWVNMHVKRLINESKWEDIPAILQMLLKQTDMEDYCEYLYLRITREMDESRNVVQEISEHLLKFENAYNSCVVWKILHKISSKITVDKEDAAKLVQHLSNNPVPYRIRFIIPFMASVIQSVEDKVYVKLLAEHIFALTEQDCEMRYIAALATNELGKNISCLSDEVKIVAIKTAVILLQDEDEDIRNLSINFFGHVGQIKAAPHPAITIKRVMSEEFLSNVLKEPKRYIPILHHDINLALCSYSKTGQEIDEYNPFAHDSKNIYIEVDVIQHFLDNLKHIDVD